MKIFLVEDDRQYAEFVSKALAVKGLNDIEVFHNAESCLEAIRNNRIPALVILDYFLPGMNGLLLHTTIKKEFPVVQTIILSANSDANLVLDLVKKGIRKYVIKNEHVIDSLFALIEEDDDLFIGLH